MTRTIPPTKLPASKADGRGHESAAAQGGPSDKMSDPSHVCRLAHQLQPGVKMHGSGAHTGVSYKENHASKHEPHEETVEQ